jgi:iron complex transport system substrate-binding protein
VNAARKTVLLLVPLLLMLLPAGSVSADSGYPLPPADVAIQNALGYLRAQQAADGGIGGFADSAWACIAIAAAGEDPNNWDNGGPSLVDYLKSGSADLSGEFNMGTFLARMVLAAVAAGEDPTAFGTWSGSNAGVTIVNGDYLSALESLYNGTQFLQDLTGDPDSAHTLNDDFWAVRALILAGASPFSSMAQSSGQCIVDFQEADGGWTWGTPDHTWYAPDSTDVDNTAAAVVALCLCRQGSSDAVQDALSYLQANQDAGGGFGSIWMGVNVQSTAWAVDAIGATGVNPAGSAWTPASSSPIDYLLASQEVDGSFGGMIRSTSDAIVALVGGYYQAQAPGPDRASVTVGGTAHTTDKMAIVLPWLALSGLACVGILIGRSAWSS